MDYTYLTFYYVNFRENSEKWEKYKFNYHMLLFASIVE